MTTSAPGRRMLARALAGTLAGAAVGLAVFGVEEAANALTAQPPLRPDELARLAPVYLALPGAIGLVAGLAGARRAVPLAVVSVLGGLLVGARAAETSLGALGGLGAGLALGVLAAGVATWLDRRWPRSTSPLLAAGMVFVPAMMAVNHNAYASPTEPGALVADAVIAATAAVVGAVLWLADGRGPRSLATAGSLGALGWLLTAGLSAVDRDGPSPSAGSARTGPDVVLVVIDTLRADRLGSHGNTRQLTPHLDALAERGVRYADVGSAAPWTLASFGSLLTGLYPHLHGAGVNPGDHNTHAPLRTDVPTLAEHLSAAGYRTGALVTNGYIKRFFGLDRGFDHYDDALGLAHPVMLLAPIDVAGVPVFADRYYRQADRMTDAALTWWEATEGGPRFLLLHYMDVHKPYLPPDEDLEALGAARPDPAAAFDADAYDAELRFVDRELGRFLAQVDDDTVVVVTSDHGETLGERPGAYPADEIPPDTLHGHTLYQELLHVPLLVAGGPVPAGVTVDRPVRSLDVVPTVLALAGAQPMATDGAPLFEVLGQPAPELDLPVKAQATLYGTEKRAVRVGKDKLIATTSGDELYDLVADPRELRNLDDPAVHGALAPLLPGTSSGTRVEVPLDLQAQLQALGYSE